MYTLSSCRAAARHLPRSRRAQRTRAPVAPSTLFPTATPSHNRTHAVAHAANTGQAAAKNEAPLQRRLPCAPLSLHRPAGGQHAPRAPPAGQPLPTAGAAAGEPMHPPQPTLPCTILPYILHSFRVDDPPPKTERARAQPLRGCGVPTQNGTARPQKKACPPAATLGLEALPAGMPESPKYAQLRQSYHAVFCWSHCHRHPASAA